MKRKFSELSLKEVMGSVAYQDITSWEIEPAPRAPSDVLKEYLRRCFHSFDVSSDDGKLMLIDALLIEIVPSYPRLKIWKDAPLETESTSGIVDYLIAPKRAYLDTPLICVTLARRDNFDDARVECMAQMAACRQNNERDGLKNDLYGIVSNGQSAVVYRLLSWGQFSESPFFALTNLPVLLGAIDVLCLNASDFATMSRDVPDEGEKVTLRYFFPEELHLMRNCLIAAAEQTFVRDEDLRTLTGRSRAEYAALSEQFGTMLQIGRQEWLAIVSLIGMLTNFPIRNAVQLWKFLGVSRLHLDWFGDRMLRVEERWLWYSELSAKEKRARTDWVHSLELTPEFESGFGN